MRTQNLHVLLLLFISSFTIHAQKWTPAQVLSRSAEAEDLLPNVYKGYELEYESLIYELDKSKSSKTRIVLPTQDGNMETFMIQESNIFHPDLSARYPSIKAFKGYSIDTPGSYIRMGYGQGKMHAMVLREGEQATYIDHVKGSKSQYAVYYKNDYGVKDRHQFECLVDEDAREIHGENEATTRHGDCQLRRYRLAMACTGEYASFHGGTVESVLAAYNVAMTRVNGIYERDAGITMELIANTDELIFFDSATDPYTNNNGATMLNQNQNTIDDIIGFDNYDIGHVFSTGGGGIAQLRSPCGGSKARGVTGLGSPINDPFYVDYVAHEIGHQFGGNHTQNNSCQRNSATAMEPGSASTIMGYAGICTPNVQNNSDDHFHSVSLIEIANFVTTAGNECAEIIPTTNSAPIVTVEEMTVTIPASTTFFLTAIATDADGDMLTYCWEQMDNEIGTMPPQETNEVGPMFRSISPTTDPRRFFPRRSGGSTWEVLPSVSREMNFICTVRDNNSSVGCTGEVDVEVNVFDTGSPFRVTEPNTAVLWPASDIKTVTWDVSGSNEAPINASEVDIFLSLDGGETFDLVLAEDTPNDGTEDIIVPDTPTDEARVVIIGNGVFYDISDEDFSITAEFSVDISPFSQVACGQDELVYTADFVSATTFTDEVNLSVMGLPEGATATLSASTISTPASVDITINGLTDAEAGSYIATLTAEAENTTINEFFTINIQNNDLQITNATMPADGMVDVDGAEVEFFWEAQEGVSLYQFQLSTAPDFDSQPVISATPTSSTTTRSDLEQGTVYYWRVRARSICSTGDYSVTQAFRTSDDGCRQYMSTAPVTIPEVAGETVVSEIEVPEDFNFAEATVLLDISHTWVGDLSAEVSSPNGTDFELFDRPGVPDGDYGCGRDDIMVSFANDAELTAQDFELTCEDDPAISGVFQSIDPFADVEATGIWTLSVTDAFQQDGGAINSWTIEACTQVVFPDIATTGSKVITVANGGAAPFDNNILTIDSADPADIYITRLPGEGLLTLNAEEIIEGRSITIDDLNNGTIVYQHSGSETIADQFTVDIVVPATGAWLRNEVISIDILENTFQVVGNIAQQISCAEGADGVITATAVEGVEPYEYSIDNVNFQFESTFNGLSAGDYIIYVRDADGISQQSTSITLLDADPIELSATLDGYTINAIAEGGAGGFEYSIDGTNFNTTGIFPNLDNGTYDVIVRDANDCEVSSMVNVDITALTLEVSVIDLECSNVEDGVIELTGIGGIEPYEFSINDGDFVAVNLFDNLPAGLYDITIRDAGGRENTAAGIEVFSTDPIIYNYSVDGTNVTIDAEGGVPSYMYSVNGVDFQESNVFDLDLTQDYILTIVDGLGCTYEFDLTISTVTAITYTTTASCFGEQSGTIVINGITGGVAPYEYSLNDGGYQSESVFTNLQPDTYAINVRDANGSEFTELEVIVNNNAEIGLMNSTSTDTLFVNGIGGSGDGYSYSINGEGFNTDGFFTNIPDGNYTVTVMDGAGCVETFEIIFTDVEDVLTDNDIKVYPNPVAENLQIEILNTNNKINTIALLGLDGKLIMNQTQLSGGNLQTIDVRGLTNGLYILYVETEQGSKYQRVSVMK